MQRDDYPQYKPNVTKQSNQRLSRIRVKRKERIAINTPFLSREQQAVSAHGNLLGSIRRIEAKDKALSHKLQENDNQMYHEMPSTNESLDQYSEGSMEESFGLKCFNKIVSPIAFLDYSDLQEERGRSYHTRKIFQEMARESSADQSPWAISLSEDGDLEEYIHSPEYASAEFADTLTSVESANTGIHWRSSIPLNSVGEMRECSDAGRDESYRSDAKPKYLSMPHIDDDGISLDFSSNQDYDLESDMIDCSQSSLTSLADTPSSVDALLSCSDDLIGIEEPDVFYPKSYAVETEGHASDSYWDTRLIEDIAYEDTGHRALARLSDSIARAVEQRKRRIACFLSLPFAIASSMLFFGWPHYFVTLARSKIPTIVNIYRQECTDAKEKLSPWLRYMHDKGIHSAEFARDRIWDITRETEMVVRRFAQEITSRLYAFIRPMYFNAPSHLGIDHRNSYSLSSNDARKKKIDSTWLYAEMKRIERHRKVLEDIVLSILEESRLIVAESLDMGRLRAIGKRREYLGVLESELNSYKHSLKEQASLVNQELDPLRWLTKSSSILGSQPYCAASQWRDQLNLIMKNDNGKRNAESQDTILDFSELKGFPRPLYTSISDFQSEMSSYAHEHDAPHTLNFQFKDENSAIFIHAMAALFVLCLCTALITYVRMRFILKKKRQELHTKRWQQQADIMDLLESYEEDAIEFIPASKSQTQA